MNNKILWVILILPVYIYANGLFFNGLNSYVDITSVFHNTDTDYTIDLWYKPNNINGTYTIFSANLNNNRLCIGMKDGKLKVDVFDQFENTISNFDHASQPIVNKSNNWHHLAVVFCYSEKNNHSFTQRVFLDGSIAFDPTKFEVSNNDNINYDLSPVIIGSVSPNTGPFYSGGIDEIRVWKKSLTPRIIEELSSRSPLENIAPDYLVRFNAEPNTLDYAKEDSISLIDPLEYPVILHGVKTRSTPDCSLPLVINSFTAETRNDCVEIEWETDSDLIDASFNIYRSKNDIDYELINSTSIDSPDNEEINIYSLTDFELETFTKYFYKLEVVSATGEKYLLNAISPINSSDPKTATNFHLGSAYPNPFNPSTNIRFTIAKNSKVKISVFDMKGNLVNTLVDSDYTPGQYNTIWHAEDFNNNPVSTGTYIYQMITNTGFSKSEKMILLK